MNKYSVYCVVNTIPTDEEYKSICDDLSTNPNVKFVTRAKGSNKVLIGVGFKQTFYIGTSKYKCVQRKYYKAYIQNNYEPEEIEVIKEYIDKEFDSSYFAATDDYIYFCIRDQKKFREIADKETETGYKGIVFKIIPLYNKNSRILYTIQVDTRNDDSVSITDVRNSLSQYCKVRFNYVIKRIKDNELQKIYVFTSIEDNIREKLKDYNEYPIYKIFSTKISKKPKFQQRNIRRRRRNY